MLVASIREKKTREAHALFLPNQPVLDTIRDRILGEAGLPADPCHPFFCIFAHLIQPLSGLCQGIPSKAAAVV